MKKKITFYFRKKGGLWSIEKVYDQIIKNISNNYIVNKYYCYYYSSGFIFRLFEIFRSFFFQGEINHITGDVHFLSYLLKRSKTILTIHDFGYIRSHRGLKKIFYYLLWIWLPVKCCSKIILVSNTMKNEAKKILQIHPKKIKVIYNPLSSVFKFNKKKFNKKKITILQVGSSENKNLINHIRALLYKDYNFEFRIICNYQDITVVNEMLKYSDFDYYIFHDLSEKKVFEQYKQSDIVLFCSLYEGFGLPIIEAQAVGRPVITSNFGSMKEISGEAACLVDPFSHVDIFKGIEKIIINNKFRENLINKGLKNVERFKIDNVGKKYLKLYKSL